MHIEKEEIIKFLIEEDGWNPEHEEDLQEAADRWIRIQKE